MAAAVGEEVKVLGNWVSPFVMRARVALNLKGVSYEYLHEELRSKTQLLLESNPVHKKVPVLIHSGRPICESMIIVQYVDDVWSAGGPPILPSDPYDRAMALFWAAYIDHKLVSSLRVIIRGNTEEAMAEAAEETAAGLQLLQQALERCGKGVEGFFGGDTIGYLDIALGSFLTWIEAAETMAGVKILDEGKVPALVGWAERFCSAAAVKEVMPEAEKLVEYTMASRHLWNAATH